VNCVHHARLLFLENQGLGTRNVPRDIGMASSSRADMPLESQCCSSAAMPIDSGLLAAMSDQYAFCYCEENVFRAIELLSAARRDLRTFAVITSSFVAADPRLCFPGSWHRSCVVITTDRAGGTVAWDYHVFCVVLPPSGLRDAFVLDFDSALCLGGTPGRLRASAPFADYVALTFRQCDVATVRLRVVPGAEYLERFSSTRAHMLPVGLRRKWLQDPERRAQCPPGNLLGQVPPGCPPIVRLAEAGGVDLAQLINMHPDNRDVPGKVLSVAEFAAGAFQ